MPSLAINTQAFLDAVLGHQVTQIDLRDVDLNDPHSIQQVSVSLQGDRVYKFVNSGISLTSIDSLEWNGVSSAVEVYMLPRSLRWPTMYCKKQSGEGFVYPEFAIRRMNNLHRHRVLATLNRLWHVPEAISQKSDERIVWAGSPGCGKTIAVNEIILECVLMLQKIGTENNEVIKHQFFFRNENILTRFYFDNIGKRVSFELLSFEKSALLAYLQNQYEINRNSFVLYEMGESEKDPVILMPFLLSTSCRELQDTIKTTLKSSHSLYLYDSPNYVEFEFFINVCHAFGGAHNVPKQGYLDRFELSGGVLRTIFDAHRKIPVKSLFDSNHDHLPVFSSLRQCNPANIVQSVNTIVGVKFNIPFSFDDNVQFLACKPMLLEGKYFPPGNASFEFCHYSDNWAVKYLSDEIAIEVGKIVNLPYDIQFSNCCVLYQIQESISVYGGILKAPIEKYRLPDGYYMRNWEFFNCSNTKISSSMLSVQSNSNPARILLSLDAYVSNPDRDGLISLMPETTKVLIFQGQYLKTPFCQLSPEYVYRSSVHNGPVYDALTADPVTKRLFLFQSTLEDPYNHPVSILHFNKLLSNLKVDTPEAINEIYFYMIVSAHQKCTSHHLFSFVLDKLYLSSCFLTKYSSAAGIRAFNKAIINGKTNPSSTYSMSKAESESLSAEEKIILKTTGCCYKRAGDEDLFYKISLCEESYVQLFSFLKHADKLRPYVCRAEFTASNVYKFSASCIDGSL